MADRSNFIQAWRLSWDADWPPRKYMSLFCLTRPDEFWFCTCPVHQSEIAGNIESVVSESTGNQGPPGDCSLTLTGNTSARY